MANGGLCRQLGAWLTATRLSGTRLSSLCRQPELRWTAKQLGWARVSVGPLPSVRGETDGKPVVWAPPVGPLPSAGGDADGKAMTIWSLIYPQTAQVSATCPLCRQLDDGKGFAVSKLTAKSSVFFFFVCFLFISCN